MAKVEIDAFEITTYQGPATPDHLRLYASKTFTNQEGQRVIKGRRRSNDFCQKVDVTITDGVIQAGAFEGDNAVSPTIIDGVDNGCVYTLTLHDANGKELAELFSNLKVSNLITPTTWENIEAESVTAVQPYRFSYLTWTQFQTWVSGLSVSGLATALVAGIVKLTYPPVSLPNPIAVGANDPVWRDANQTKFLGSYASLSAAITAIGSDNATLVYADTVNVTTNTSVPANIRLVQQGNGVFNISAGITLTILNGAGFQAPADKQIFTGDGTVYFSESVPTLHPEWVGAKGDNVTDDSAAFAKLLTMWGGGVEAARILLSTGKIYYCAEPFEPDIPFCLESHGAGAQRPGAYMRFAVNTYGIIVHHASTKTGVDDGKRAINSIIRGVGVTGTDTYAETHTVNVSGLTLTKTAGIDLTTTNGFVPGYTLTIGGANGHTYVIDALIDDDQVTLKKPRLFATAAYGSTLVVISNTDKWALDGSWIGQNLKIGGTNYEISNVANSSAFGFNDLVITLTTPFLGTSLTDGFSSTVSSINVGTDELTITGTYLTTGMAFQINNGGTLPPELVDGTVYYAIKTGANTIKAAATYADALATTPITLSGSPSGTHTVQIQMYVGDMELQSVAAVTNKSMQANIYNAITLKASATVQDCQIWHWNGHGVSLDSSTGITALPGTTPNCNNSTVIRNSCYYNRGAGIFAQGINSNQCLIQQNDCSSNLGGGFYESGFLGNQYKVNHSSVNLFAAFWGEGATNFSVFDSEYTESGQPSAKTDQYMLVIGGDHGAGIDSTSSGGRIEQVQGQTNTRDLYARNNPALSTRPAAFRMGSFNDANVYLGFGAAANAYNLAAGGSSTVVRKFAYSQTFDSDFWHKLFYGGNVGTDLANTIIAYSDSLASAGGGKLAFPLGFRFGLADPTITKILKGTVTINPASITATTVVTQTFTLTGAAAGDSLILNIPAAGLDAGILVCQTWVSGTNEIKVTFHNTTGGAIDIASADWTYTLIRS